MARFDPHAYPDRFAFDARARQIRSEELSRLAAQLRTWIARAWHPVAPTSLQRASAEAQHVHR